VNVNMTLILQMLPLLIIIVLAVVGVMSIKKIKGPKISHQIIILLIGDWKKNWF